MRRTIVIALWLGALLLVTGSACDQPNTCPKDAGGNTDCPTRQYNPPDGLVNDSIR